MTAFRKRILVFAMLVFAAVPLALAQGTYTQIDVPGALLTAVNGIDSAGDLVGVYDDASNAYHGFLLSNGLFTTIDYPGAQRGTYLNGINDVGQIVGYAPQGFSEVSFLYDLQSQTFTKLRNLGSDQPFVTSINNAGTIAGYFPVQTGGTRTVGFELIGLTYGRILPPGQFQAWAYAISGSGEVIGDTETNKGSNMNFSFSDGKYKPIVIPNSPSAGITGVNNLGTALVGYYGNSSSCPTCSFVYQSGTVQLLVFPESVDTSASGVNDAGVVVGSFTDSSNNVHGFTWTPPVPVPKK